MTTIQMITETKGLPEAYEEEYLDFLESQKKIQDDEYKKEMD